MYCDNGTNFIGAHNLLQELTTNRSDDEIKWKFLPPGAPHWGGIHEALVKSSKRTLTRVLEEEQGARRHLREHELRRALCEVIGILNSRPLTYESSDPGDARALTPNHFLIQRASIALPQGNYGSPNPRQHFHYVQSIVDKIWNRWTMEYLPSLLSRNKWTLKMDNLKVGDVVIIVGVSEPRGKWKTGTIREVHPGKDNLVRAVTVQTDEGIIKRPITKICPLEPVRTQLCQVTNREKGGVCCDDYPRDLAMTPNGLLESPCK